MKKLFSIFFILGSIGAYGEEPKVSCLMSNAVVANFNCPDEHLWDLNTRYELDRGTNNAPDPNTQNGFKTSGSGSDLAGVTLQLNSNVYHFDKLSTQIHYEYFLHWQLSEACRNDKR